MPQCFARHRDGSQCENEAKQELLYCQQHRAFEADVDKKVDHLVHAVTSLGSSRANDKKDLWDKISSSATLISGLIVGLIGISATAIYNDRELKSQKAELEQNLQLKRVEITQKFFPHLIAKKPEQRRAALLAVASLGDERLATDLVKLFGGQGSREVLTQLASTADNAVAEQAAKALDAQTIFTDTADAVFSVEVQERLPGYGNVTKRGTGFFVSEKGHAITAAHLFAEDKQEEITAILLGDDSKRLMANLTHIDVAKDLAIIQLDIKRSKQLPLNLGAVDIGESVTSVGFRSKQNLTRAYTQGVISEAAGENLLVNLAAGPGFSGAPTFNAEGQVVGFVIGASDVGTFVKPLSAVSSVLQSMLVSGPSQ